MIGREYLYELEKSGHKYSIDDIIFIAKDEQNKLIWLERGNEKAGLMHIIINHKTDFENALGIKENEIALYLYNVITNGKLLDLKPSKASNGEDRIYEFDGNYYTFVAMGNNGFIVTSFPFS